MIFVRHVLLFFLCVSSLRAETNQFLPVSVWYGGGKARAPMLESEPRAKKESWRKDVRQIKALGFNTLRCWIDWASGEPTEKQYQLDTFNVLLELAEEEGLKVILQVYMDSAPHWVGEKYPDSKFVSAGGEVIEPESSPGYCRDHAGVRAADLAFYAALAQRARKSSAFLGWDLWSEPHVINWANPTYIARPEFCFCPHTKARFRRWLQAKYGSIEKLNDAWYRRFANWNQVDPARLNTILSYTDYIDWKAFIVDKLGEDLRERYQAVKRIAPDSVVTSHAAGVGLFASPHHWEGQADDWMMARQVDYYGTSFYPKHSAFVDRDLPWRAALLDFTRSFGFDQGRRGFWIGELQAGFGTVGVNVSPTVTPADLRIWTWSALARGARGVNYYAWYPMSSGYESGGFGMIDLDGTITERAREAGTIARTVQQNQKLFLEAKPAQAEIAILYNPLAHFVGGRQRASASAGPQNEVASIERDSWLGVHRALFPLNVDIDYVHISHITPERLKRYKLVYFPYPLMVPEQAAAVLKSYVEQGGALVAEARLGWNNERGNAAAAIPGLGLSEVMGCRESSVETAEKTRTQLRWMSEFGAMNTGELIPGRWFAEVLQPLGSKARVVAEFGSGQPAAVLNQFGKGKTLTVGTYLSAAYQAGPAEPAARFFRALLAWAGVAVPIETSDPRLEVRFLETPSGRLGFVFNHAPVVVQARISWPAADGTIRDISTKDPVNVRLERGRTLVELPLEPWAVRVLEIAR